MLTAAIVGLIILGLLGAPLFTVIAGIALVLAYTAQLDIAVLIVELYRVASSPNLLAIPLFALAGVSLAQGGAPKRLIAIFQDLLGWMPGGLGIVSLLACAFFTAFSGASGITILALGGLLYPMLRRQHYNSNFSLGLLTTSGSLGLLFPPSLAILLYGVVSGVSIEDLFLAGLLPGAVLIAMLGGYSIYTARHDHVPRYPFSASKAFAALRAGAWDLSLPPAILGSIYSGLVTVSEAAACTAAYVIFVECVIYRSLNVRKQLTSVCMETSVLVGSILIIVAVAMALNNLLIDADVPMTLLAIMQEHVDSKTSFLLLLNVFLLIAGCMMDIFSAIIVLVPLILPIATRYGVDPVHLGIIFLANLEIGYSTPPVGMNLFIASQRFRKPIFVLFRAALPFLAIMLLWLMFVTYVDQASLWWQSPSVVNQSLDQL
ncbi:MAG TPA: TRAP transporter large permease subunit [Chromatiaceae bacterium]|nr:TRAP transporter large permease subunit [Chromatiaceae bacterium]HIO13896.1 TRAP transporter large permease subunit [Chromatiales bacterium]